MFGRARFVVVAAVVAVAIVVVVLSVLLLLPSLRPGGAPGGGTGEAVSVATPTATPAPLPPVARLGGWSLEVLSGESTLSFLGERLRLRVRCNNTGGGDWPVMPRQNFFLVLANGAEVRASDTDLWLGFYYVKRGESISFSVEFAVNGAEPAKLVYREGGKVMEVPLRGVKIEKYRMLLVPVRLVSHHSEANLIASASFLYGTETGSCGRGRCYGYTAQEAHCTCIVPLGERKANLSLKLQLSSFGRAVMKGVEGRVGYTNTTIEVLSPREPVELEGRAGVTAVLSVELPPDPKTDTLSLDLIVHFEKKK